jgi:hypothetical protein
MLGLANIYISSDAEERAPFYRWIAGELFEAYWLLYRDFNMWMLRKVRKQCYLSKCLMGRRYPGMHPRVGLGCMTK